MHSLFLPKDPKKKLTDQYAELKEVKYFAELGREDQLFVWHFACEASEIVERYKDNLLERAAKAYDCSFVGKPNAERRGKYVSLNFPENVRSAAEHMMRYRVDIRLQALIATTKLYTNVVNIMSQDISEFLNFAEIEVEGETDAEVAVNKRKVVSENAEILKKYIDTATKARGELPKIIQTIEQGFGVVEIEPEETHEKSALKEFIRQQRES